MREPKKLRAIMLSSTFTDLQVHRRQVREVIGKLGFKPDDMESRGAFAESNAIESSLQMVRDSAAYVGIISHKYGQTPFDSNINPSGLSISELEFNEALRLNRPILLFIMGDEHPLTIADVETDPDKIRKLRAFRERAKLMREGSEVKRVYEVFEDQLQFATSAETAIGRFIRHLDEPRLHSRLAGSFTIRNNAQATVEARTLIAVTPEDLSQIIREIAARCADSRGRILDQKALQRIGRIPPMYRQQIGIDVDLYRLEVMLEEVIELAIKLSVGREVIRLSDMDTALANVDCHYLWFC